MRLIHDVMMMSLLYSSSLSLMPFPKRIFCLQQLTAGFLSPGEDFLAEVNAHSVLLKWEGLISRLLRKSLGMRLIKVE